MWIDLSKISKPQQFDLKLCQKESHEYVVGDMPDNPPDFLKKARQVYPFYSPCFKALQIKGNTKVKQLICNLLFTRELGGYVWDFNNTIMGFSDNSPDLQNAIRVIDKHMDDGFIPTIPFVVDQVDC